MKFLMSVAVLLVLFSSDAWSSDFSCRVTSGVYKVTGEARLADATKRDQSVIGKDFKVNRRTGEIDGDNLLANAGEHVKVLRNENEIINTFEVMSTNKHSDVKLLHIKEFEKKTTFTYYFGWLGLFLTGECSESINK